MRALRTVMAVAAAVGISLTVAVAPVTAQTTPTALVTVVHGLRGVVADVYLDGAVVLQTFEPERSTDPLPVPVGTHTVEVRAAGSAPTTAALVAGTLTAVEGVPMTAVVHLDAAGQATLTTFDDDTALVPAGQARAVVRHTAAAAPIDVNLGDTTLASGLVNPQQAAGQVGANTYDLSVTAAGTSEVVVAPQRVPFAEGAETAMYLIGSQPLGTLSWIAVQTDGLQTAPASVQTGNSLVEPADTNTSTVAVLAAALAGAVGVGALVVHSHGRRRHLA